MASLVKWIATALSLLGSLNSVHSQDRFELNTVDSIWNYTIQLKKKLIDTLLITEKNGFWGSGNISNHIDSIQLFPAVRIDVGKIAPNSYESKIVFDQDSDVYAAIFPSRNVYMYNIGTNAATLLKNSQAFIDFMQSGREMLGATQTFVCYFLNSERYLRNNIFAENSDGLRTYNKESNKVLSGFDIVALRYGSYDAYIKLNNTEKRQTAIKKNFNVETVWREYLKNSWTFRTYYIPSDTATGKSLFIRELKDNVTGITTMQLNSIEQGLVNEMKINRKKNAKTRPVLGNRTEFMEINLVSLLEKNLTKLQFEEYINFGRECRIKDVILEKFLWDKYRKKYITENESPEGRTPLGEYTSQVEAFIVDCILH